MSIFSPTSLYPNSVGIIVNVANDFTWEFEGTDTQTDYQLWIYKNSDNSLIYDSTQTTSSNKYHTVPSLTLTAGIEYKFRVKTWGISGNATSTWSLFYANSIATVTMGALPTDKQTYEFTSTYAQSENIYVKYYRYYLYLQSDLVTAIDDSEDIYPDSLIGDAGLLTYEFDGMISGTAYSIKCIAVNQDDMVFDTGFNNFTVTYSYPPSVPDLIVTSENIFGTIELKWSKLQILGFVEGGFSYVSGKFGQGLSLNDGSYIYYNETIPEDFTIYLWIKIASGFNGDVLKLGDDGTGMRVFFNGDQFGFSVGDAITIGRRIETAYPSDVIGSFILLGVKHGKVLIKTANVEEILSM